MLEVTKDQWLYKIKNLDGGDFKIEFWKRERFVGFGFLNVKTQKVYHWPKGLRQLAAMKCCKLVDAGHLTGQSWTYDHDFVESRLDGILSV